MLCGQYSATICRLRESAAAEEAQTRSLTRAAAQRRAQTLVFEWSLTLAPLAAGAKIVRRLFRYWKSPILWACPSCPGRPHFHAVYGEFEAVIDIETAELI